MSRFVELKSFYKNVRNPVQEPANNEIGHFNIFRVEDLWLSKHRSVNYNRRDFFKISLVTGQGKIYYADQCIEANGSVLVFTNPMIPYFWETISEEQTGYVCIFTEAFFNRFNSISEYPVFQHPDMAVIPLTTEEAIEYDNLFVKIYAELQSEYVYKYDLLRNLVMEIIHGAQKMQPAHGNKHIGSNASERIAGLFAELLERQFPVEFNNQRIKLNSASAFATQLNIHVNHLNKALKEITGQTTTQLINDRILQEAKILLRSTTWTIAEIAWSLGFEEPNHFSSFFKTRINTTPKNFRLSAND
ncbi:helix-turn-helix domain-containing protein [Mucilaginibacter agri]|uniref:Helix-turn-helix domain-containing protein n=1 Tax=Mucilaginibacter agri TaxID=2695265 RepID=A0A965ZFK3_9SPHI|nr:response regulator transcription factor [Mucilaginibacter agri]NCD70128.1 helix-turn-helix domain-containing protein [Mucilaginibacter agri]